MVLPPALCLTSFSGLHSLPTENLLQLTSEAKPTLAAPLGVQRMTQKLAVCRDGGVQNMYVSCLRAIVLSLGQNRENHTKANKWNKLLRSGLLNTRTDNIIPVIMITKHKGLLKTSIVLGYVI